jgi:hypothetical protein
MSHEEKREAFLRQVEENEAIIRSIDEHFKEYQKRGTEEFKPLVNSDVREFVGVFSFSLFISFFFVSRKHTSTQISSGLFFVSPPCVWVRRRKKLNIVKNEVGSTGETCLCCVVIFPIK